MCPPPSWSYEVQCCGEQAPITIGLKLATRLIWSKCFYFRVAQSVHIVPPASILQNLGHEVCQHFSSSCSMLDFGLIGYMVGYMHFENLYDYPKKKKTLKTGQVFFPDFRVLGLMVI